MRKSIVVAGLFVGIGLFLLKGRLAHAADQAIHGPYSVAERLQEYGATVEARLAPDFAHAGVPYPPAQLTLVVLKQEKELQVYAAAPDGAERFIRAYPILAASGHAGPKLAEGDEQVPEGIYAVESLNPNSAYHLALHVGYPNAFDRTQAAADGRANLGGDIMIHGSDVSIGCVAMGDAAAEDLFVLAAKVGLPHVRLLFAPADLRVADYLLNNSNEPPWTSKLYTQLKLELMTLPSPPITRVGP
jgi:hypothetical protein